MKKSLIIIGLVAFGIASCGGSDAASELAGELEKAKEELESEKSTKGAWSDEEMAKAEAAIASEMPAIVDAFGQEKADEFAACYLEAVEANYDNFASADSDLDGCTALAQECSQSLMADMMEEEVDGE